MSKPDDTWKGEAYHVIAEGKPVDEILNVLPNGSVTCNGVVIGSLEGGGQLEPKLTLDMGWCRAAGFHLCVLGDRAVDKGRKPLVDR